jgi:hypothetical protein
VYFTIPRSFKALYGRIYRSYGRGGSFQPPLGEVSFPCRVPRPVPAMPVEGAGRARFPRPWPGPIAAPGPQSFSFYAPARICYNGSGCRVSPAPARPGNR